MESIETKILVTGASGFIGNRLAEVLVESGERIRLLVRDPSRLSDFLRNSSELIVGDLGDMGALKSATKQVETIYHCAANVNTWDCWERYYQTNVQGVENLIEAARRSNTTLPRLIHLSSVDVYGFPEAPCDETAALNDGGFYYGKSKIMGEALIKKYAQDFGLPFTILRPCNVIGPGSQFIERIGSELRSGVMLTVGGGNCNAGMVYIDNLVDAIIRVAASPQTLGESYNLRDSYDVSWKYFLDCFRQQIKGKGLVINLPFPIAAGVAFVFEAIYKRLAINKEPLLHPLLVHIFGRTCGHSAQKIMQACGPTTTLDFDTAMKRSCRWFLEQR